MSTTGPQTPGPVEPPRRPRRRPTLRGEVPTETIPLVGSLRGTPYRDPRVTRAVAEERAAAEAMDLALRVAEVMLRCGASAHDVEAAAVAVGVASGLEDMDVDLTMQSMHMQCRTTGGATITRLRVVRSPRQDFARLAAVHALVDDLVSGEIDTEQASAGLRAIVRRPRVWSRWVVALARGGVAAGVAITLGAGHIAVVVAVLSALAVGGAVRLVEGFRLPDFYLGAVGGAIATLVAFSAYALGRIEWVPVSPSDFAYVMAGGIVAFLPARTLTSAMEDVLSGYPVTGSARLFEVFLHTFGLIVGVAGGLGVALQLARAGSLALSPPPIDRLAWASASLPSVLVGSILIGVAGAITLQNGRRMLLPAGALAVGTVALATVLTQAGIGRVTATGVTAVVLGFVARIIALRLDAPSMTLAVPASFGLLPGLSIFVGLYQLTSEEDGTALTSDEQGLVGVLVALGIIFAIATGSTLGDRLAAPLDRPAADRRRAVAGDATSWVSGWERPSTQEIPQRAAATPEAPEMPTTEH